MRIIHPLSRTTARAALSLVVATAAIAATAAEAQDSCPPIIASLLPQNRSAPSGHYLGDGEIGSGGGSADIPFEHRCIISVEFPARVSIEVWYYGGEAVLLLEMQGDAPAEQFMADSMRELEVHKSTLNSSLSDPRREKLAGGEIVYSVYMSECPPEEDVMADIGEMIVPNIKLRGVTGTDNARMQVMLEGMISVDAAKAAVTEVFANLRKADFSKVK